MEEKIVKTYKFDELSEEAKERAIEDNQEINMDCSRDMVYEVREEFVSAVKEKFGIDLDMDSVVFDIGRGGYFGVTSDGLNRAISYEFGVEEIDIPDKVGFYLIDRGGGINTPSNTEKGRADVLEYSDEEELDELEKSVIQKRIYDIVDEIIDLCGKYYVYCQKIEQEPFTEEAIIETLKINEYDFKENGEMFWKWVMKKLKA